jgi:hypothetical protein
LPRGLTYAWGFEAKGCGKLVIVQTQKGSSIIVGRLETRTMESKP